MSCNLKEYIEGLKCQLKDPDAEHWTDGYLAWAICIAAKQVQSDRKDLFKEDKRIKLSIGCYTSVCRQGCDEITGPFRIEGDECADVEEVTTDEDWTTQYFPPIKCFNSSDEFKVERVETDLEDPCTIKITPPVPDDGKAYWIIAKCQKDVEEEIANGVLPSGICDNLHAFTQLVLFYAYSKDSMVNADDSQAQMYFNNYLSLMELSYLRDLSFRERSIYLGQLLRRAERQ